MEHDSLLEVLDETEKHQVDVNEAEIPKVIVIDSNSEVDTIKSISVNGDELQISLEVE